MRYGSVCSGIEAASAAWGVLGWEADFVSEIEAFPSAVLAHHYPDVPNHGDMTAFKDWPDHAIDLLVGGTPCQSFSVAGLRAGLADPRGSLMLTYLAIAARYRPRWVVWENVPGVLSSNGGRDFGTFLGGLGELGYGFAYRVLDAQFCRTLGFPYAVPQRRRRVFVVGYLGDWRRAAAVLFDGPSLRGDPTPRRQAGQGIAGTIDAGTHPDSYSGQDAYQGRLVPVAGTMKALANSGGWSNSVDHAAAGYMIAHSLRGEGFDASEDGTGRGTPLVPVVAGAICKDSFSGGAGGRPEGAAAGHFVPSIAASLTRGAESAGKGGYAGRRQEDDANVVAWSIMPQNSGKDYKARSVEVAQPIMAGGPTGGNQGGDYIQEAWAVRRLTPTECERLQGFPDGYTAVPYRKKPAADGPRYKALGNSMAVNVMRVLGERIALVDRAA